MTLTLSPVTKESKDLTDEPPRIEPRRQQGAHQGYDDLLMRQSIIRAVFVVHQSLQTFHNIIFTIQFFITGWWCRYRARCLSPVNLCKDAGQGNLTLGLNKSFYPAAITCKPFVLLLDLLLSRKRDLPDRLSTETHTQTAELL